MSADRFLSVVLVKTTENFQVYKIYGCGIITTILAIWLSSYKMWGCSRT